MEKWMSVSEAAVSLGISERAVYARIKKGKVTSKMEDGNRLVLMDCQASSVLPSESTTENASEESQTVTEALQKLQQEKEARISDLQSQVNQQFQHMNHQSEQIHQLTQQLDHMAQLVALAQKSIQQLTEQNQFLLSDQRQPKRSFWKRLARQKPKATKR